jgi:phosphoribosylanthranilate isomerase
MTRVKICGLTDMAQCITATNYGADFIGMVFAPSKRHVSPEKAVVLSKAIHSLQMSTAVVGVFVNMAVEEVNRIANYCLLDWVQLSGDEPWTYCQQIEKPIIKAIHIDSVKTSKQIYDEITTGYRFLPREKLFCLLDSRRGTTYGGTGQTFDWHLARDLSMEFPLIVAGGLNSENVVQLLKEVKPWGVDVSSGVEINNQKDDAKIVAFIKAVKQL